MTSDERREVAARLRDLSRTADADGYCTAWDVLFALGMKRCDAIGFVNAVDAQRLAELIDPTCEMPDVSTDNHELEFMCSSCGCSYVFDLDIYDSKGATAAPYNHCPNCGARVVSGDE